MRSWWAVYAGGYWLLGIATSVTAEELVRFGGRDLRLQAYWFNLVLLVASAVLAALVIRGITATQEARAAQVHLSAPSDSTRRTRPVRPLSAGGGGRNEYRAYPLNE